MEASQLEVLYEDNHLIAINKPAGMLVQIDTTGDKALEDLVKEYISVKYEKPGDVFLGVTHRIDRPVSGIVLFAKTTKALTRINEMFKVNKIKKTYWAIVKNRPEKEKATLTHYIFRDTKRNVSRASEKEIPNSKQATLSYSIISSSENYHLLEVDLQTGRHHQIRCQLAKIGCPIKGDLKYGFPRSNPDGGISLHSRQMVFEHPVKKEKITITAPTPKDNLWDSFVKPYVQKNQE